MRWRRTFCTFMRPMPCAIWLAAAAARCRCGRGMADFPSLLGKLEERNYRGYLTIARHAANDPLVEIGAAVEYLRSL